MQTMQAVTMIDCFCDRSNVTLWTFCGSYANTETRATTLTKFLHASIYPIPKIKCAFSVVYITRKLLNKNRNLKIMEINVHMYDLFKNIIRSDIKSPNSCLLITEM